MQPSNSMEYLVAVITALKNNAQHPVIIALDGRSGVGKSTLAKKVAEEVGGVVVTADNFWAGGENELWDNRSPEERVQLGIDWKRLAKEVLIPLRNGEAVSYRPFDFQTNKGLSDTPITIAPHRVIVLDGAYSARPELTKLVDLSVLVQSSDDTVRRTNLVNREGATYMDDWHRRWDPAEDYYFSHIRPESSFDLVVVCY
ncbi:MAG: hypothetical protein H6774_03320 [Pseudomonadales bacterium]|nr:hypothetical protein [Candidatus Woesebacteria bacterium]MCB9802094.1 hypothetical protein [Pseudomonadales bacterium]